MGLKDIIAKVRTGATGAVTRHRDKIDQGLEKIGEAANTRTGGRYETHIRKGREQARVGLDKFTPDRDQGRPGTDHTDPGVPDPGHRGPA